MATHEMVRNQDVQIDVIVRGDGPLIVMLPSGGRGAEDFDPVAQALAERGFRVACPQPRGIGASRGPKSPVTLHDFAADTAAVIRHQGDRPAVVVGHAYGNWVARMTATDYPQLVRGVVILAAGMKDYPKEIGESVVKCAQPELNREERLKHLKIAFFAPGNDPSVWLTGWYPEVMHMQHQASLAVDVEEYWRAGQAPILDLLAAADPFRPPHSRDSIRNELGRERVAVEVIANASHCTVAEQPLAAADAIARWVGTLKD